MRIKIGITTAIDSYNTTSLLAPYITAIEDAGALPILIPYASDKTICDLVCECDGILFSGGVDVCPQIYGEKTLAECGQISQIRDETEIKVFNFAIEQKKPILAICRGIQLVNVLLGGTLYQDIPSQVYTEIPHVQSEDKFTPSHSVNVIEGTPLYTLVKKGKMVANSFHHQEIKDLAPSLSVMAVSNDSLIEAVFSSEPYIRAYQWHPERIYKTDSDNRKIFDDFIRECERKNNA